MSASKDLTGNRYGKLTVNKWVLPGQDGNPKKSSMWKCTCDCGKKAFQGTHALIHGKAKSCGCGMLDGLYKHGKTGSKSYSVWSGMMGRCYNSAQVNYCNYGGRGITVCDEWREFKNWYRDMMPSYKKGLLLDRIDNDAPYSKENCKWSTMKEQHRNKRSNVWYEYNGKHYIQKDLLKIAGICHATMYHRMKKGWTTQQVFGLSAQKLS